MPHPLEYGCPRLSHFNPYSFVFGKKYGQVDSGIGYIRDQLNAGL
jgi:hypothetical protein